MFKDHNKFDKYLLICVHNISSDEFDCVMLALSAKWYVFKYLMRFWRSFILIMIRMGIRTDFIRTIVRNSGLVDV